MNKQEIIREIRNIRSYFNSREIKQKYGIHTLAFDVDLDLKKIMFHKLYRESGIYIPDSVKYSIEKLIQEANFKITFIL